MNHLRELMEHATQALQGERGFEAYGDITLHSLRNALGEVLTISEQAQCFFMGEMKEMASQLRVIPDVCAALPYEWCWFEATGPFKDVNDAGAICGSLIGPSNRYPGTLRMHVFLRMDGRWGYAGDTDHIDLNSGSRYSPSDEHLRFITGNALWCLRAFLSAMICTNISQVKNSPSAKLQAARQKRGKQPLFSYWTLHLRTPSARGKPLGGTHSSPRVHLRRGHQRQYAPGKYTWVQPHAVGNKSLGMVHKDYDGSALAEVRP